MSNSKEALFVLIGTICFLGYVKTTAKLQNKGIKDFEIKSIDDRVKFTIGGLLYHVCFKNN